MEQDIKLLKGNEAVAEAAIRCGCDGYFGYPITPQSEIMETLGITSLGMTRKLKFTCLNKLTDLIKCSGIKPIKK